MINLSTKTRFAVLRAVIAVLLVVMLVILVRTEVRQEPMPDFSSITNINARKDAFFGYLRPVIETVNAEKEEERSRLLEIQEKIAEGGAANFFDRRRLRDWAERYEIDYESEDWAAVTDELLLHLDQIPESMVLAQAAMESAWGTSRFAVDGKNLFGQWCYSPGCGLVPARRAAGASHEVRVFNSAEASIRSYYRNINGHAAYTYLREMRADVRSSGEPLSGLELVDGLQSYSERGQDYVDELKAVISFNDLE